MSKEVSKVEEDEKKRKEGEKFCKQVFSEIVIYYSIFYFVSFFDNFLLVLIRVM